MGKKNYIKFGEIFKQPYIHSQMLKQNKLINCPKYALQAVQVTHKA